MYTEVFDNIDTLIEMAGSTLNIDEIDAELMSLKKQIKNKKNEIEELRDLISDARYFNASDELVDKNIEISLKNKISRLNKKLKNLKNTINEISISEEKLHKDIVNLKNTLSKNEKYVVVLSKKLDNSKNNSYYKDLLDKENENVKILNKELKEKNKEYESILKELELNNQALSEINEQLEDEKKRLNDVVDNLKNPNTYIDEDLKESDNNKLKKLEDELAVLEKKELEYLTDAKVIGIDAKDLIVNNEVEQALAKIKELVTIVKTKPFMDITNKDILNEELEKKEVLRLELSNIIDSKKYDVIQKNNVDNRVNFINNEIETNNKNISNYENEINLIDDFINSSLGKTIVELEKSINELENVLKEYRNMLKDKNKSLKVKANIENAIQKKEKEKILLDSLLNAYKEDFIEKLNETNILMELIVKLKNENDKYNNEKYLLSKASLLDLKTKDLIEEEKDKEELKKLNEEIKAIKYRLKFDKNIQELYDSIEMSLEQDKGSTMSRSQKKVNKSLEVDSLFESVIEPLNISNSINNRLKVIDMIPVETVKK